MHHIIVLLIIIVIVFFQIRFFINTKRKIKIYSNIFPEKDYQYTLKKEFLIEQINNANHDELDHMLSVAGLDSEKYYYLQENADGNVVSNFRREEAKKDLINKLSVSANGISVRYTSETLDTIIESINNYLENNKTVSDFHLMKDIVDRNCEAKEEEIHTQIPIPLYLGLMGTMGGILIGILYLWLSGGISDLLSNGSSKGTGADGVEALLGGVALAMIASIIGIFLTTLGSNKFKTATSIVERNKHTFLSWIQVNLLPTLSDNVVGAIREMTGNLTDFNNKFSDNTSNLGEALAKVNESYKLQTRLIDTVNKIQEGRTAATNIKLLNKLIESSEQIGQLAEYLHNTNDYLNNVRILNEKLDLHESRTQLIEQVGLFFKTELEQIESRKYMIAKSVGKNDDYLQQAFNKLTEHTEQSLLDFRKSTVKQLDLLKEKTEEINIIVSELKNLTEVKKAVAGFESSINAQNLKIDSLVRSIHKLAETKSGVTADLDLKNKENPNKKRWVRYLVLNGVILGSLITFSFIIANWDSILEFLIKIFRIA